MESDFEAEDREVYEEDIPDQDKIYEYSEDDNFVQKELDRIPESNDGLGVSREAYGDSLDIMRDVTEIHSGRSDLTRDVIFSNLKESVIKNKVTKFIVDQLKTVRSLLSEMPDDDETYKVKKRIADMILTEIDNTLVVSRALDGLVLGSILKSFMGQDKFSNEDLGVVEDGKMDSEDARSGIMRGLLAKKGGGR